MNSAKKVGFQRRGCRRLPEDDIICFLKIQGNQRVCTHLDVHMCSQLKERPGNGVCGSVMPSKHEEPNIGGKGVGVYGGPILVVL